MMRIYSLINGAIFLLFPSLIYSQKYGSLHAVDDVATTGPMQSVWINVVANDTMPCVDTYTWQLTATLNPLTQGTAEKQGAYLIFHPSPACRNTTVHIPYALTCDGATESAAEAVVTVTNYNLPVNVLPKTVACWSPFPINTGFDVDTKFHSNEVTPKHSHQILVYSLPIVGDLNGDKKPEILAIGLQSFGGRTSAFGRYIVVMDGQTGETLVEYDVQSEFVVTNANPSGSPYHSSPSYMAIADVDNDGKGEIIMAFPVSKRNAANMYGEQVAAFRIVTNSADEIIDLQPYWTASIGYKAPLTSTNHLVYDVPTPYIADLNGDGIPEVIVYNKIYNARTGRLLMAWDGPALPSAPARSSISTGTGLFPYEHAGIFTSYTESEKVYNRAFVGRRPSTAKSEWENDYLPVFAVEDIDGDGELEVIAGNRVYHFNFKYLGKDGEGGYHGDNTYTTDEGPRYVTLPTTGSNTVTYYLSDCFTRVTDIDGDGYLDVINISQVASSGGWGSRATGLITVWDPRDPSTVKAAVSFFGDGADAAHIPTFGIPFIGDINGKIDGGWDGSKFTKKLPEIGLLTSSLFINANNSNPKRNGITFHPLSDELLRQDVGWDNNNSSKWNRRFNRSSVSNGQGHIFAVTYCDSAGIVPYHRRLKLSWAMEHNDRSANTGLTIFDFNNDGAKDLVYRDETTLRVISPKYSGKDYVTVNEMDATPGGSVMFRTGVTSLTGYEAPIIADVNMDASADIVVTRSDRNSFDGGRISVFEYKSGTAKWAPAPPVWNQAYYNPRHIGEDLRVPSRPTPMLSISYTDSDGTAIYPYNGSWEQLSYVKEGTPDVSVVRHPDAELIDMTVDMNSTSTTTTIMLTICNNGEASIPANTQVAFYDGGTSPGKDISQSALIGVRRLLVEIYQDECVYHPFTLGSFNARDKLIWARIMDNGRGAFPAYGFNDCDLTNNTTSGTYCPDMKYSITPAGDSEFCGNDSLTLTATSPLPSTSTPSYQWFRNSVLIDGATAQNYVASLSGEYVCYITSGFCQEYTPPKKVTVHPMEAYHDHAIVIRETPSLIPMLANDATPSVCAQVLKIEKNPQYGKAEFLGNRILYTPNSGYTGSDVLTYSLADSIAADVRIRVIDPPDHIVDATCVINAPAAPWKALELPVNLRDTIDNCAPLTVGDIDGDGRVEVLAYRPGLSTDEKRTGMKMLCYGDGQMELKRAFDFKDENGAPFSSSSAGAPAIARYNGGGHIVVMNDDDFLLYAFDENGNFRWKSGLAATDSIPATNIGIADFNGDGIPEVYTGAHVFSIANGNILCDGDISGAHNKGLLPAGGGYATVAVDMDGDGLPELCAGSQIYRVSIPDSATYVRAGTMSVFMELDTAKLPANAAKDGATLAADIDNDGLPEVIVVSLQSGNTVVYVWKPLPNGRSYLIGSYALPGNNTRYGIPAIGNIDADPYPEIVFLSGMNPGEIFALKYNPANAPGSQIGLKWRMTDSGMSGSTGISLFDFNQDGIAEIVYRNETTLRIFDGSGSSPTALSTMDNVASTTLHEMPVIADIDGDNRAEIIVAGGRGAAAGAGAAEEKRNGYLRVFKSAAGASWAPARKVWNQYAYHAVHINSDLTVPERQLNPSTLFPGAGGAYGDSDDVRPCNAFMQQLTAMNSLGKPLFLAPHGEVVAPLTTFYSALNDSLALHFSLTNSGEAGFSSPLYVTAYKDGAVAGAAIVTDSILSLVNAGDTVAFEMPIVRFSTHLPAKEIVVRINDRGAVANVQEECSSLSLNHTLRDSILMANSDRFSTIMDVPADFDVLANDSLPKLCGGALSVEIETPPLHGVASVGSGNMIRYEPFAGYVGADTVTYRLSCNGNATVAAASIMVHNLPGGMGSAACLAAPPTTAMGKIEQKAISSQKVHYKAMPFVGDIDRDGFPEVVAPAEEASSGVRYLFVFDHHLQLKTTVSTGSTSVSFPEDNTMTFLVANVDDDRYGEIVTCTSNQDVRCYSHDGKEKWKTADTYSGASSISPSPIAADIDGDGKVEIFVANMLIAGESGKTLLTVSGANGIGLVKDVAYMPVFADIDNDGIQELVAGDATYKLTVTNRNGTAGNSAQLIASMPKNFPDGYTAVADIDQDGDPDVIVTGMNSVSNMASLYVWEGTATDMISSQIAIPSRFKCSSRPAVGDVDGNGSMTIVVSGENMLEAYRYDPTAKNLVRRWRKAVNEISASTAVTMFDFDQDGRMELVHRDEKFLRIINGDGLTLDSIICSSPTGSEYPVIVDLDMDGHADILVSGNTSGSTSGSILIIRYGSKLNNWAPARPVWNQHAYNSLNVDDTLGIPRLPINPTFVLPGNRRIFNNFLQQQTTRAFDGANFWPAPDIMPVAAGSKVEASGQMFSAVVAVYNQGDVAIASPVHVTLYRESVAAANKLGAGALNGVILPGDTGYVHVSFQSAAPVVRIVARVNDDNGVFPFTAECKEDNNEMFLINTDYRKYMKKTASVNGVPGNGAYVNPVSVLYGDVIRYRISAYNVAQKAGTVVIRDTLPAYLEYVAGTAVPSSSGIFRHTKTTGTPPQDVLNWTLNNIASMTETVATFDAQPAAGACASQPMFINRAWITTDVATVETDSSVYHQGAGASIVSFAAGYGGAIYNAPPQALDYRTSARAGVLAVPDEGYAFAGWSHDDYYSLRGERISAQSGIAHYDTIVIFGNVELTADFELIHYPVRYYLNGGDDEGRNPLSYTVLMDAIALEPPLKEGDVFIGWTGSNGDTPQKTAVIPKGATGELEFYANYLYSGREDQAAAPPPDKIWSAKGALYIRTSKTGSIVKIYSTNGKLTGLHTILSSDVTIIKLQPGVYIVALNEDIVQKVVIK